MWWAGSAVMGETAVDRAAWLDSNNCQSGRLILQRGQQAGAFVEIFDELVDLVG